MCPPVYTLVYAHVCTRVCTHIHVIIREHPSHGSWAATQEQGLLTLESFRIVPYKDLLARRLGVAWPLVF